MKRVLIIPFFCFSLISVFGTEASDFAENKFAEDMGYKSVHITVKKEHTQEYQQPIGDVMVPAITYGYGDLRAKKCKKTRISYICLLDENCKPFWSFIVPSK